MTFTLMLTSGGGELVPQLIQHLKSSRRYDLKVVIVDAGDGGIARYMADGYKRVPFGGEPGYVNEVAEFALQQEVNLIIPGSDEEAVDLAQNRDMLESRVCKLACADVDILKLFSDKSACYERLKSLGIAVPLYKEVDSKESLEATVEYFLDQLGGCVVKPAVSRGGRNVFVLDPSLTEVQQGEGEREVHLQPEQFLPFAYDILRDEFPLVVMQRLVEPVHDLDMLGWQGDAKYVVPRKRINSAVPNSGHMFLDNQELISLGQRLVSAFNLSWLYDCDIMYDDKGVPQILEINPRPSGSSVVSMIGGVPLIEDMVALSLGEAVSDIDIPVDSFVVPYKSLIKVQE